ncbi:MAG TPA: DUF885 family protein, partial [Terriglobales bacterium]|nr:DUF885 family protein [Terriglobales bacterium]
MPLSITSAAQTSKADFDKLVDDFFDVFFQHHPSQGTAAGFHQYDTKLEDFSKAGIDAETADMTKMQAKLAAFDNSKLGEDDAADLQILQDTIRARFLELQNIQMWRKDADEYTSGATESIFQIMKRNFAPQAERLRSVIAREKQIPKVLEAARKNLNNPPRVYTEVAIEQLPGVIGFFKEDVPNAFSEVKDAKLLAEFKKSNQAVIEALGKYQAFLEKTVLPASKGDFRIGGENYSKKLLYEDMVDIPLDRLLEIGYADLHKNQAQLKDVAAKIDPNHTPHEVLAELEKDHPPADQLLQTFRNVLGDIRSYIEAKKIITIPSTVPPIVEDTPPFARALTTASMDTPGAYETKADEAMFNVTTADPTWK